MSLSWSDFKAILNAGAYFRYFSINSVYIIIVVDSAVIFSCYINQDGGSDQTDFETNYKANALNFSPAAVPFSNASAVTYVSASASSISLISSNSKRKGLIFYNDSSVNCYIKFGTTAATNSFTVKMGAGATFILETNPVYFGEIDGIWDSATGAMAITELT